MLIHKRNMEISVFYWIFTYFFLAFYQNNITYGELSLIVVRGTDYYLESPHGAVLMYMSKLTSSRRSNPPSGK